MWGQRLKRIMKKERVRSLLGGGGGGRTGFGKDGKKAKSLMVGTLNVKNIETNDAFVCELLKKYDILALQEHWLFNFQLPDIEKRFTTHSVHSRAVNEDNPLPPIQKPRGFGGVAILYKKDINLQIKKLSHGGNRIVTKEVYSTPLLCICSVYMPSRNSKNNSSDKESYMHCLDQLEEILNIYSRTHAVFILGDMNASLVSRKGNLQDTLLQDFFGRNDLVWRQNGEVTFRHPNNMDKAEIDYIFYNKLGDGVVGSVAVERNTSLNTSDHVPVDAQVNVEYSEKARAETTVIQVKPKWDRCDETAYKRSIRQNLLPFETFLHFLSVEIDILQPVAHLNTVLKQATYESIPNYKSSVKSKKQRRCWTQKMQDAMKHSRLMWWEWRKAGEPEDPGDPARKKMVETKRTLRKVQRLESAKQRKARVEDIISSDASSKTFFKLINRQRKFSNTQLQSLVVDGEVCETDQEIREGWAIQFQKLATPLESDKFDKEYKEMIDFDSDTISTLCAAEDRPIPPPPPPSYYGKRNRRSTEEIEQ